MIRSQRLTLSCAALAVLLLSVLPGCTPKHATDATADAPASAWIAFRQHYCVPPAAPGLLVKASLYYTRLTPVRRTNRTIVTLWGDFSEPMRLDLAAGIGKLLAHIREDRHGLLVYYPTEGKAFTHTDPVLGATRLGMPFPFSLTELARVTAGDFSGLLPRRADSGEWTGKGYRFTFAKGLVSEIALDTDGRPVLLKGRTTEEEATARDWTLEIGSYGEPVDGKPPLPGRISLALEDGETGVLRIRSRALRLAPWSAKALALPLPDGTVSRRLDSGGQTGGNDDIPIIYEDK
ncbi:hypothetical protein [Pseudodesulfovibrio sp.]|uniref:hypothetical protein n=1 Tax=unclassified Pseudodesulfovibrio TaxID=2661612 RepID=UPI003B000CF8